jgi:diacylglycerol kinase family enzyme
METLNVTPTTFQLGEACVIFNPASGRGYSRRLIRRLQKQNRTGYEYRPMTGPGAGEEMAEKAVREGFRTIVAAGGDGTAHEVANGILNAGRPEVVCCVWPMGSANDYAFALGLDKPWQQPPERLAVIDADVGIADAGGRRKRYFINGFGLGFNAAVTVEARKIKWIRGMPLYALGIIQAMRRQYVSPRMTVTFDDQVREAPTLALSINLGKREGGFPLTLNADLSDGRFDYLHAGPLTRRELLRQLPNMATGKIPTDHPKVWRGQCQSVGIESDAPVRIHLDGEFLCHPEDGVRQVSVTLRPRALRVVVGRR